MLIVFLVFFEIISIRKTIDNNKNAFTSVHFTSQLAKITKNHKTNKYTTSTEYIVHGISVGTFRRFCRRLTRENSVPRVNYLELRFHLLSFCFSCNFIHWNLCCVVSLHYLSSLAEWCRWWFVMWLFVCVEFMGNILCISMLNMPKVVKCMHIFPFVSLFLSFHRYRSLKLHKKIWNWIACVQFVG